MVKGFTYPYPYPFPGKLKMGEPVLVLGSF